MSDDINFIFIKNFLPKVKGDIMLFISEFYLNRKLTKCINFVKKTKCINCNFIALIPKAYSPRQLNDFRPISLVGSMYKI